MRRIPQQHPGCWHYKHSTYLDTDILYDDRTHAIFVNQKIQDDTPLGKLMADFSQTDPSKFNYPILAKKVHELKETERGESKMSKELQEIIDIERKDAKVEGRIEGRTEAIIKTTTENIKNVMESFGVSIERAMEILDVPEEECEKYRKLVMDLPDEA